MLALILSYALVAYLFVPTAFFRFRPRAILKKFQRSRVEELTFAVEVSSLPLLLTLVFAYATRNLGYHRYAEWADYREIFAASYSEEIFRVTQTQFWSSLRVIGSDQAYCVPLACSLAYIEGHIFTRLIQNYFRWQILSRRLLGNVSEWYLLLTTVAFPPDEGHRVAVDILTNEDHLYDGFVGDYFLDTNGELSGLLLTEPRRFDRQGYLEAKKRESATTVEPFWRGVPGKNMYVPRDKILNINLRYPCADESGEALAARANTELAQAGLQFEVVAEDAVLKAETNQSE